MSDNKAVIGTGIQTIRIDSRDGNSATLQMGEKLTIMCPQCFKLYRLKAWGSLAISTINREDCDLLVAPRIHIQCNACDYEGEAVTLDNGIAEAVAMFNILGYKTEMSCDGHEDGYGLAEGVKYRTFILFETEPALDFSVGKWHTDGKFLELYSNSDADRLHNIQLLKEYLQRFLTDRRLSNATETVYDVDEFIRDYLIRHALPYESVHLKILQELPVLNTWHAPELLLCIESILDQTPLSFLSLIPSGINAGIEKAMDALKLCGKVKPKEHYLSNISLFCAMDSERFIERLLQLNQ